MNPAALVAAISLAVLHLFAGRLRFLGGIPRSRWLSTAGGISVAYVIVHLLPELAEYQVLIGGSATAPTGWSERHVYVLALIGLVTFYGVERVSRGGVHADPQGTALETGFSRAVALSFGTYALYNAAIGNLLVRRERGVALFALAMGLHFLVTDYGLREHHGHAYERFGRWFLSAAIVTGAVVGYAIEVPEVVVGLLIAFVGGGTILNVLKEELPTERESRFGAFFAGAAGYTVLLLAL